MIGSVVLAAGRGRRLGGVAKALLTRDGRTFLAAVADSARAGGVSAIAVVVGPPFGADVAEHASALGLECVTNPTPERGMASSVAVGFEAALRLWPDAHGALLWPVDHDRVSSETVTALLSAAADRASIVVPRFEDRGGHPVFFGTDVWPELARCASDQLGARYVVRRDQARVTSIAVDDPAVVRDVDVPADLEAGNR